MTYFLHHKNTDGFSLLELIISVVIIGILSTIAIPSFHRQTRKARLTDMSLTLQSFRKAFDVYLHAHGSYPPDHPRGFPSEMQEYLSKGKWEETTPLGGNYNWEGPDVLGFAGISIQDPSATSHDAETLDDLIDDGNLETGSFRITNHAGFRYTYFLNP